MITRKDRITLLIISLLILLLAKQIYAETKCTDEKYDNKYVRKSSSQLRVIVFVHGFTGDADGTWKNTSFCEYWPSLLTKDALFDTADIFVYEYESYKFDKTYSIMELAQHIKTVLSDKKITEYQELLFIAHSLGGIVVREYLLENPDIRFKTRGLFLLATPMNGLDVAGWVKGFSRNPQIEDLQSANNGRSYLAILRDRWINSKILTPSYCVYELKKYKNVFTVPKESVAPLCNSMLVPINTDHVQIVKPASKETYTALTLLRDIFRTIYPPAIGPEDAPVVIANCTGSRKYSSAIDLQVQSLIDSVVGRSRISSALPVDWKDDKSYASMLIKPGNPKLIVIHLSCFQQGGNTDSAHLERTTDFVNFLRSVSNTDVKILVYSQAFDGPRGERFFQEKILGGVAKEYNGNSPERIFHFAVPEDKPLGSNSETNNTFRDFVKKIELSK